jgi:hypothetical protein
MSIGKVSSWNQKGIASTETAEPATSDNAKSPAKTRVADIVANYDAARLRACPGRRQNGSSDASETFERLSGKSGVSSRSRPAATGKQKAPTMFHATLRPRFAVDSTPQLRVRRADTETLDIDFANRSALIRVR